MDCEKKNTKSPSVHMEIDGRDRSDRQNGNLQASIQRSSVSPPVPFTANRVKAPLNSEHSEFLKDNTMLFYQKLREVHESCGLGLVASVAGAVLDLFMLYKEVTFRGGFAMVTKHSRWSEVASAVNFISKVSDPSFQLQQIYSSLLYQFELIYYFGTLEKRDRPPAPTMSSRLYGKTSNDHPSSSTDCPTVKKKLQTNPCQSPTDSVDPGSQSVMVGSQKLNGEIKDSAGEQVAAVPSLMNGVGFKNTNTESGRVGMQVRVASAKGEQAVGLPLEKVAKLKPTMGPSAKGTKKKDPEAPTRTRTAYHYFLCKECDRLKKLHGQSLGPDLRKRVIDLWKNLSESDRLPYIEESRKDKERFDREMVAYKERQNMQNGKRECKIHNPEPSVVIYNEHQNMQIGRGTIPNPESSTVGMVVYKERQNVQNGKRECKIQNPEPSMVIYNEHQNMQIGRGIIPNPESNSVGMVAYEERQTMETGKAESKIHNPEPSVVIYKEHQNVQIGRVTSTIPDPDCSRVEVVAYEEHQDMLIGIPQSEIHEPSRPEIHNLEPSKIEMVSYKEHQGEQVDMEHNRIHNPFPSEAERAAYGVSQNTHIGRGELTAPNPDPSFCDENHVSLQTEESDTACGHNDYHVSLQMEELDKLRKPDQSMVELAVELMENAEKLDASLQIQLGDFLSVP